MNTDNEIAWSAGIFEGEGWMGNAVVSQPHRIRIQINMTDRDVLERMQELWGGRITDRAPKYLGCKQMWCWSLSRQSEVNAAADAWLPYMSERRRRNLAELRKNALEHLSSRSHS